ncbi:MAG: hypothetical protein GF317_05525 [Candidatus Lokiarchaeota archaeon]|nr:hypothetical protein [Candidatus Lokiarchaeota archaeon]MBD3199267.1 hypothetical protein [Candidatus Lokiarchaeota archaeon]
MSMNRVLEYLRRDDKEFTTSEEIKEYSRELYYNYQNVIRYLMSQGMLLKIFKGIYYVKNDEELESKKLKYSLLELVGKGLELKGINNWYYGLFTALRLNGVPSEHEKDVFYIMSDRLFRSKPIKIGGRSFKFIKLKYSLFNFGVENNKVRFSDFEKTVMDFIYLWKYNGIHRQKIIVDISDFVEKVDEKRIRRYAKYYPKSNMTILQEALANR